MCGLFFGGAVEEVLSLIVLPHPLCTPGARTNSTIYFMGWRFRTHLSGDAERGTPSCLLSLPLVVRDRSEFHKLNRRTVVNDHRYCHTWRRTVRFNQDFLALERLCQVIHFKSNVR